MEHRPLISVIGLVNSTWDGLFTVTLNLDKIFNTKSVAVIGASDKEGSVGYIQ